MSDRICGVEGCGKPHYCRRFCVMHYRRWKRHGNPDTVREKQESCSVTGCDRPHRAKGFCYIHYDRWLRNGDPGSPDSTRTRHVILVGDDAECWPCTVVNSHGYGVFNVNGRTVLAHRIVFQDFAGPIPDGMEVDHRCRNKACANVRHLRIVTKKQQQENLGPGSSRKNNTSGVRGVYWSRHRRKWVAQITHRGKVINLGGFAIKADAAAARLTKANELFTHNDIDRAGAAAPGPLNSDCCSPTMKEKR